MGKWLSKLFQVKENGREYKFMGLWGDAICDWTQYSDGTFKMSGFKMLGRAQRGDVILRQMQSGKIGRYLLTKVHYPGNPPDMFFGEGKALGYKED